MSAMDILQRENIYLSGYDDILYVKSIIMVLNVHYKQSNCCLNVYSEERL